MNDVGAAFVPDASTQRELEQLRLFRRIARRLDQLADPPEPIVRVHQANTNAGNTIEIDLEPVQAGWCWYVERLTYGCSSSTPTTATLYFDAIDIATIVDFTNLGNGSPSDSSAPLYVPAGRALIAVWAGVTTPARAALRLQYRARPLYSDIEELGP